MRLILFFIDHKKLVKLLSGLKRPINQMDTKISDLHKISQGKSIISCYDWIPTTNCRQIRNVPQSWNGYPMRHTWAIIRELNRAGWVILVNGFWRERNIKIGEKKVPHRFSGYLESVSRSTLTVFGCGPFSLIQPRYIAGAGKTKLVSVLHLICPNIK